MDARRTAMRCASSLDICACSAFTCANSPRRSEPWIDDMTGDWIGIFFRNAARTPLLSCGAPPPSERVTAVLFCSILCTRARKLESQESGRCALCGGGAPGGSGGGGGAP
eukprot:3743691-Prymnesium_polylepis.1